MRKLMTIILVSALLISTLSFTAYSLCATVEANTMSKSAVLQTVTNWLVENYDGFYHLKDIQVNIIRELETDTHIKYTVALSCMTKLLVASKDELPFVKGLYDEVASQKIVEPEVISSMTSFINSIDFSDDYSLLNLNLVVMADYQGKMNMYYQDAMDTKLYSLSLLELDYTHMYQSGKNYISNLLSSYGKSEVTRGYSLYDRVAARDYAQQYTGNYVSSCYDDGSSCGFLQNRLLWNNSSYPYISNLKHADCADLVSQSMAAGGIPVDSGLWDRFNDGNNNWAWTYVPGLKYYMVNQGYWDTSTFAAANAGNILLWSDEGHVAIITLNDTVTHRFTAHTNDLDNYQFFDSTTYDYYTIKTSP